MSTEAGAIGSAHPPVPPVPPVTPRSGWKPILGHAGTMLSRPLETLDRWAKECGDLYLVKLIWQDGWVVSRPEEIERVLTSARHFRRDADARTLREVLGMGVLTSDGAPWMRQRRLLQPAFHRERVTGYARVMAELSAAEFDRWEGGPRDFNHEMMALTLRIASATLFGDGELNAEEVGHGLDWVMRRFTGAMFIMPRWLPVPTMLGYARAVGRLDRLVREVIARRRERGGAEGKDVLSLLLHAQDEDGSRMGDTQVRDEVLTLLLAGHETTAVALTWSGHLLSHHPEVQERLHDEVAALGGPPSAADVPRLKYAEAVLQEAMRLYPPAWAIGREVAEPFALAGRELPVGARVLIFPWVVHRDERFYRDPLAFRPERWLDGSLSGLPPYAYFPFGGGQRLCIGKAFAMMEGVLLLSELARRFRFKPASGFNPEPVPAITLRPKNGLTLQIEKR